MELEERLYAAASRMAKGLRLERVCLGLGYTAVAVSDGGLGVANTWMDASGSCRLVDPDTELEDCQPSDLLEGIRSEEPLLRSLALALINAINSHNAMEMPRDEGNTLLFSHLGLGAGSRVCMVGYIPPLVTRLHKAGAEVEVLDQGKGLGDRNRFQEKLASWADRALISATSLLNRSLEDLLACAGDQVQSALLGPSTPLIPQAFSHLPVHLLCGMVPLDQKALFRNIRQGKGTPAIKRNARKVAVEPTS
ncbi:MAG: DUF364 domain-containing protein [Desulfohalobiaceae bacterium]|nr:DUF364 domain-containing protein [Desulfohalobiaceae bacterium]